MLTASVIRATIKAARTSQKSASFYETARSNIPENIRLHMIYWLVGSFDLENQNQNSQGQENIKFYKQPANRWRSFGAGTFKVQFKLNRS
jgi:hypothetical protein